MGRRLEEYTHEELIEYIKELKKQTRRRYGLVWEEKIKPEKVVEECETKLPVVKEVEERALGGAEDEPTNIIIEGDNYHALSVLNYTHAGKIDVIYIDPPYNTGNKDFIYNDCYVDKEDTFRHSKWLSFMDKRLRLAKTLLSENGIILISIDDNEQAELKLLCESLFGAENFIGCAPRKTRGSATTKGTAELQTLGDYLLIYAKHKSGLTLQKKIVGEKKYPYSDDRGDYYTVPLQDNGPHGTREARPNLWYPIYVLDDGELTYKEPERFKEKVLPQQHQNKEGRWMWSKKKFDTDKKDLLIKDGRAFIKHYYKEGEDQNIYQYEKLWLDEFQNAKGTKVLNEVLGEKGLFNNPKPVELINYCIGLSRNKSAVVLDFFAGSGTTGQAVMELNKQDGGHRQFILVTNNEAKGKADAGAEGIAEKVTYPRIKTVITGIRPDGTKYSDGIPANLRYFKTDFVEKGKTTDDTREALITECSDMIRIRENAFEHVASAPEYRFYKNDKVFVPIIFDQFAIAETWEKVEEFNTDKLPVHCYNFSYNRHANEEEIPEDTRLEWTACSIPETVLEVYKKIFRKKEV